MRSLRIPHLLALLLLARVAGALPVTTHEGLVVAANAHAAKAGASVLAQGGNAADAIVATAFALSVVEPHSSGLGGGGFLLYFDQKTGRTTALDFREVAPAAATPELFLRDGQYDQRLSRFGGRSVGVPGAVAGYAAIARKHGTKPLRQLVQPAVRLAENGFVLTAAHRRALQIGRDALAVTEAGQKAFLAGTDPLGKKLVQKALAKHLRDIGNQGPQAFYSGKAAEAIVRAVQAGGGVLSLEDLKRYEPRPLTPLEGTFRGHRVVTMPPPSAGGATILQTLALLERKGPPTAEVRPVEQLHVLAETWKRSYAARAEFFGDPRQSPEVTQHVKRLLSPATLDAWAESIGPNATPADEISRIAATFPEGPETTNLVAIDRQGNVAVMTTTLNGPFGSGVYVPEIGVMLNNENDDFAPPTGANLYGLVGGRYNAMEGGRTPLSTMAPTIVFDGARPWIAVGAPGGSTIATTIAQVIVNVVDGRMDVEQAVSAPRIHAQFKPEELMVEPFGLEEATKAGLAARGHKLRVMPAPWGNATAAVITTDGLRQGAADPRFEGAAVAQDQL